MKKRLLSILLTACLLVGLLPTVALAAGPVNYWDWDTDQKKLVQKSYTGTYTELTNENPGGTTWNAGWYVVTGDNVTISSRVTVTGDVHLILTNGCSLTVNGGIQVQDNDNDPSTPSPNALTIYGQSTDEYTMGKLTVPQLANGDPNAAIGGNGNNDVSGIGDDGGTITINGGIVEATSTNGAGIGGGSGETGDGRCGKITINGGSVTATSDYGAGIGSGSHSSSVGSARSGGKITINGGIVEATSTNGAGIGGGAASVGCTITISGGTVTATSTNYGAGIGGGFNADSGNPGDEITISGGSVTATGKDGAGIGGGGGEYGCNGGKITISGGTVEATSTNGAGIGGGYGYVGGGGGTIIISGGTVTATATGTNSGAGIGGGYGSAYGGVGGTIIISGGTVTATSYGCGASIGGGCGFLSNGDNGTFQTQKPGDANGNAVLFASSIGDQTNQSTWHGIIFEGSPVGIIYGTEVAPTDDFTIEDAKTLRIAADQALTIPEGVTMTIENSGTVDNSGKIYVDGTLTGAVSGNVYYHLALTSCTATGSPSLETHDAKTYATENSEITLTPVTPTGYQFKYWTVSGADVTVENNKFAMPASAVTVAAEFVYTPPAPPTYPPIILDTEGGTVTVSPKYPTAGSKVTITATPDEGYEVDEVTVTDRSGKPVEFTDNGDGTYSFKQPSGTVTIEVTFRESALPFVDVPTDAYYYNAVQWAVKNGITYGTSDTTFSPNDPCTRAQMVTFLWRASGCPEPEGVSSFTDVSADTYYAKAVAWAVENGITGGVGDNKFAPDDVCTRAQMATFLCRLAGGTAASSTSAFTDVSADAYYAEAVQWAVENGITYGTGDGSTFSPDEPCTRGQMVTFLYRFFVK